VDAERLAYMANQIARNFAAQGEAVAVAATAEHLRNFWDPRMIAAFLAAEVQLDPIAAAARERLAQRSASA
jgi:formate dehydrogenase subunit delta